MSESEAEKCSCWTIHFSGPSGITAELLECFGNLESFACSPQGYVVEVLLPLIDRPEDWVKKMASTFARTIIFDHIECSLSQVSIIGVRQGYHLDDLIAA